MSKFQRLFTISICMEVAEKRRLSRNGKKNENVFDIQQGVSILLCVKERPAILNRQRSITRICGEKVAKKNIGCFRTDGCP